MHYVDAPVTGSKTGAAKRHPDFHGRRRGTAIERLKPLFAAMGKKVFRMGETGKGQAAKLVMNLQIALIYEGFAEALTLAAKLGVDAESADAVDSGLDGESGVVEYKAPFVLNRDFSPNFPLRLMHKDIRLALEAAKEARVKLPGLETVEEVYDVADRRWTRGSGLRGHPHAARKMGGRRSKRCVGLSASKDGSIGEN